MVSATERFLGTVDILYVLVDHISDFKTLLSLALVNHLFLSVCAAGLTQHLRIGAPSIINPDTIGRLIQNPNLHHVQSLEIDAGRRSLSGHFHLGAASDYYENKLPQLAAGLSELLPRMPGLLTLRWYGEDVPLEVVETLQHHCPRLQNVSWLLRRFHFGPAAFPPMLGRMQNATTGDVGPALSRPQDLASFAGLTSFALQRGDLGLDDWAAVLLALGEKSPRLAHLLLSRDPMEYYAKPPLSIEDLSDKYHEAGGRPLQLRSLHLREGFQFLAHGNGTTNTTVSDEQHPAPYLEHLIDTSLLEAISIHVQRAEDSHFPGTPDPFYPVTWTILSPTILPGLQSLWVSHLNLEAYNYLRNNISAPWLATIDLTIANVHRPARPTDLDYMVALFSDYQDTGPASRRVRSIIVPELRNKDMSAVESYGAVAHFSAVLPQQRAPTGRDLRSFYKLHDLESIYLFCDNTGKPRPAEEMETFGKELAAACPKLRYVRVDTFGDGRGPYRFRAWTVRREESGAVALQELGAREELTARPGVYDETIKIKEAMYGYTRGCHIREPPRMHRPGVTAGPGGQSVMGPGQLPV